MSDEAPSVRGDYTTLLDDETESDGVEGLITLRLSPQADVDHKRRGIWMSEFVLRLD